MAEIAPFRALRFTPRAGDPARLLAPPYDVISDDERRALEALDPHNCVRLILPQPAANAPDDSRYAAAATTLRAWLDDGVLARDDRPAIYRYHQRFAAYGHTVVRKGFIARVRLHRFDEGVILPHERTLSGPKADRLQLMRATRAHFSQIFGLYPDPARATDAFFDDLERTAPDVDATTPNDVTQRLWRLTDARAIAGLCRAIAPLPIYIADGHHRYETMLALRDELRPEAGAAAARSAVEYGVMFFCNMDDPGLLVFPTHRVLHGLAAFDRADLLRRASRYFTITEQPAPTSPAASAALRAALLAASTDGPAFALASAGAVPVAILRVRPDLDRDLDHETGGPPALPLAPALRTLDVTVLHALVLETLLGIDRAAQERQTNLRYLKDWDLAVAERDAPGVQAVFLMNPTKVAQVKAVADAGEVMPQKSTFFYPKIASGLVMNPIVPTETVDPVDA